MIAGITSIDFSKTFDLFDCTNYLKITNIQTHHSYLKLDAGSKFILYQRQTTVLEGFFVKLCKGDTVAFFSPSIQATYLYEDRFNRAYDYLASKGFKLKPGLLTGKSDFYRSGTIEDRANELNSLIRDPEVKCIISTIGGSNSSSLLPYLDYEAIKKTPKIFVGYSDVTTILLAIYNKTGVKTFYGPALVASFGEFEPLVSQTFDSFLEVVNCSFETPHRYSIPPEWTDEFIDWKIQTGPKSLCPNKWIFLGESVIEGRVIGGNLSAISAIWGTTYMPTISKGDILLIEDSNKSIDIVERLFSLLRLSDVFDHISAIILGKHEQFDDRESERKPIDVLLEVIAGYDIPIIYDFDCCHTHPMLTIPIGSRIRIDFNQEFVELIG